MFTTFIGIIVGMAVVFFGAKMTLMPITEITALASQIPVFIAAAMAIVALYRFMAFGYTKRKGFRNRRHLWEGVFYLLLAGLLAGSWYVRATIAGFFEFIPVIIIASALVITGLFRVIHALAIHKGNRAMRKKAKKEEKEMESASQTEAPRSTSPRERARQARRPWVGEFLCGILILAIGALCAANPFLLLTGVGTLFGINIILLGALILWDSMGIK